MSHNNSEQDGGEVYQEEIITQGVTGYKDSSGIFTPPFDDDDRPKKPWPTITPQTASVQTKTITPTNILVCTECGLYYEYNGEWEVCPRCGEELEEVDRA